MTDLPFHPATAAWFADAFEGPTRVQREGWARIAAGEHALLLAPTGSGKTLAAFLWCLDRLQALPLDAAPGVRVLYVSPLKALVYDVEKNLRAPLAGISRAAERLGVASRGVNVDIRTGDTSARDRRLQARNPAEILVTTPESLFLLLGTAARETLRTVETIIVDEIHALAGTKRGVHLAVSIERLSAFADRDPQRIGLSATQRPLEEIAAFLGGDRPVAIVDAAEPPKLDLQVVVPVPDMERPIVPSAGKTSPWKTSAGTTSAGTTSAGTTSAAADVRPKKKKSGSVLAPGVGKPEEKKVLPGIWPAIHPLLLDEILAHRSTIVFANSRLLCERLARALNELAVERGVESPTGDLVRAHHGSIARERRLETEELLKSGQLRAIVATSSLELGIDMGAVDLVLQVESPGSVARGLQRVGRAGHHVGGTSIGRMFPKFRGDLVECAVVAKGMLEGDIETTRVPRNALDVLAQHVVAMVATGEWTVDSLERLIHRVYPYRELSSEALASVLDLLAGRYPSDAFAELKPRIVWDRDTGALRARKGALTIALVNAGTIPDRGLYAVHLGDPKGPRLGELDEEMVFETRKGQTIVLGASTWRVEEITRDRVIVTPAPGEPGRMPFWHGDSPGRPIELGRRVGQFLGEVAAAIGKGEWDDGGRPAGEAVVRALSPVDELAARNLVAYIGEQAAVAAVPTDKSLVVERFRDELGDWRICLHSPLGGRIHAPWTLALEAVLGQRAGFDLQAMWTDDGVALRIADADEPVPTELLFPDPEEVEERLLEQLRHSASFASRFRENAGRALLLPRRMPGRRTPLWAQRLKAQNLLAVAQQHPSFPIVLETYRELLRDTFDLPGLVEVLRAVRRREIRVVEVETPTPSPFAKNLVFAWVANYLYDGDAPLAERKAQALTLDRELLRDLLGQEELRDLLSPEAVADVEADLQRLADDRRARDADEVHDLLRRLGDLSEDEIRLRTVADPAAWLQTLDRERRAVRVRVAREERWIAVEDVARYRDALGVVPPGGLPSVFLEEAPHALDDLVLRYARTHGPFRLRDLAARFGLPPGAAEAALKKLLADGKLVHGEIRPGGVEREWCDPEVLRRLRRESLARLRQQIAPVAPEGLGRFLPRWAGLGGKVGGRGRLEEVLVQLEGLPIAFSELEDAILPARVADYRPQMLDEAGAMGLVAWVGREPLGSTDGRVALYRRDRVPLLVDPPVPYEGDDVHRAILGHLERRGASFLVELVTAANAAHLDGAGRAGATLDDVVEHLWDLVWAGLVTNDTFQPLREMARRGRGKGGASRVAGGRWAPVATLLAPTTDTARAHARATMLLERYGVVGPKAGAAEDLPGGFSAVYPVLRAMEESGRVRRGYFVEGMGGAQFAMPGAVDRLRAAHDDGVALVLSAVDPANPYGALLPWPDTGEHRVRRVAGASVALVDGAPALFVEKGGRSIVTFPRFADDGVAELAIAALKQWLSRQRKRSWRFDRIDGEEAALTPDVDRWLRLGLASDYRGLVLEV